jgi:FixJ family two-component response regulator
MDDNPVVYVIDDDLAARESIAALVRAKGLDVETFPSAESFLAELDPEQLGCVVADMRLTGMNSLDLQEKLRTDDVSLPVIIITGYGDIPSAVRALRTGAVTFLQKPCREQELWENIEKAIQQHRDQREARAGVAEIKNRLARLTPDENRVLECLIAGKPNKAIAAELEIGLRTVELRRANIMKKMQAGSLAELVRLRLAIDDQMAPKS